MNGAYFYELARNPVRTSIPLDEDGFLEPTFSNDSALSQFQKDITRELIFHSKEIANNDLISIYFRGAIVLYDGKIRFDTIMIVDTDAEKYRKKISDYLVLVIGRRYPNIKFFNNHVISVIDLFKNRYLQFIVKNLSLRVHGKDLESPIAKFMLNEEVCYSINVLDSKIGLAKNAKSNHPSYFIVYCRHLVKHLLRASFEVIIKKQKFYTRDIDVCMSCFKQEFPQHQKLIDKIHSYLLCDTVNADVFFADVMRLREVLQEIKGGLNI